MVSHRGTHVAQEAIRTAVVEGSFKAPDVTARVEFGEQPSRQTVTRILRQLEADDWLERETPNSSIWRAGPKARLFGDMDERAEAAAERDARRPDGFMSEDAADAADAYEPGRGSAF